MSHRVVRGLVEAEVARIVAEHTPGIRRKSAAFSGQLAAELVDAFLGLSRDRQNFVSDNGRYFAQDIVRWLLSAPPADKEEPAESSEDPWYVEEWAGPVAGPTILERDFGMARSTLYRWQRLRLVIAFKKGRRKFVFPLRQFVDGRPVDGLKEVAEAFPDHRAAWSWLIQHDDALAASPIDLLKLGKQTDVVLALSERKTPAVARRGS